MNEEVIDQGKQEEQPNITSQQLKEIAQQMPMLVDGNRVTLINGIGDGSVDLQGEAKEKLPGIRLAYAEDKFFLIIASREILLDLATRIMALAQHFNEEVITIDMPTEPEPVLTMEVE